ncbi:SMI1/KNR4 family protein [Lacihabitans lacunae]|uniref:SMI1/KNR4 family protein n=1 Tax=Lacihabitans lacunae TaxID=1028214 RepID=A0ABV7YYN7_9BACT
MRKGFELIRTRELTDKINITETEKQLGFSLPPLYKFYIEHFKTGKGSFFNDFFLNSKRNEKYLLNTPLYEPLKDNEKWFLSISYFDDIDKVANDWKSYLCHEKEWSKFKFLRIADIGQGGGLFVSTKNEDLDVIYQVVWDWEEPYFKVADNIFELVKSFVLPDIKGILADNYHASKLYKNYEEDFWRVREENI